MDKISGPYEILAEIWKELKGDGKVWLLELCNNILTYESKREGIKFISHTLKIWERMLSERPLNFDLLNL